MSAATRPGLVTTLTASLLTLLVAAPAGALEFQLTPSAGFRIGGDFEEPSTGSDADVDESASFSLALDAVYAPDRAIQLFYGRQSTEVTDIGADVDLDVEYLHIGGVADFPLDSPGAGFVPYAVGTIGATRFSAGPEELDDETRFSLSLGGGVKYFFTPHLGVRLEGRGYVTFFDTEADVFCESDGGATCLLRTRSSAFWQIEAQAGVTWRF